MKNLLKYSALAALAVLSLFAPSASAQAVLTQTTLTNQITSTQSTIQLGSVTGLVVNNIAYIDKEAMTVTAINTTTLVVNVLRGIAGTQGRAHAAAAMVLFGLPSQFSQHNPSGYCLQASVTSLPYIEIVTGTQWLCSTVTNTWGPGWANPGNSSTPQAPSAAVASAAGQVTPTGPLFHITGTAAITGFLIPVGFSSGSFVVIPDGAFPWTTANNIATAGTAVASLAITFTYDPVAKKFYVQQSK